MAVPTFSIPGLAAFEPRAFDDDRGSFFESFSLRRFRDATGLGDIDFVQDNHSVSRKGVVRGLHYQLPPHAQGKLVRVVRGAAFDVAVDIREGSPTFGKWEAMTLTAENRLQFWIPAGFAHGFMALEDDTHFLYKTTDYWDGPSERAILWSDPAIGIVWPEGVIPVLSTKDAVATRLSDAAAFRAV